VRVALLAAAGILLAALLLVVVGVASAAPAPTCAEGMDEVACTSAVGAVVRRGLPRIHPLILATRVEPGSAPGPQDNGHRATVELDMLGMPDTTSIELYYDVGAHWGGRLDRAEAEIVGWALAPLVVAGAIASGVLVLAWWWRRRAAPATG
jgi:hypothetical protein